MISERTLVHHAWLAAAALLATLWAGAAHAQDSKQVPFSELRVTQFHLSPGRPLPLVGGVPEQFTDLLERECRAPRIIRDGEPSPMIAPFPAAIAGAVLKWAIGSGLKAADEKLTAYIKAHTAAYANVLRFDDLFDAHRWSDDPAPRSCLLAQRLVCQLPASQVHKPLAHCEAGDPALSFAAELRNEGDHLRVLPLALNVRKLKVPHRGKEAAVAVHLQLWGLGHDPAGDVRWSSGEVALASETFTATPARGGETPTPATATLERYYLNPTEDNAALWAAAPVLPMPPRLQRPGGKPRSMVAVEVRVGEVGDPGTFAKLASHFLGNASGDLTDVLVTAANAKWGPEEDE